MGWETSSWEGMEKEFIELPEKENGGMAMETEKEETDAKWRKWKA